MKKTLINSIAILIGTSLIASAAVVSVTNSIGDNTIGITESDGKPGAAANTRGFNTTEAFMTFGYFNISDAAIQSSTSPVTLFSSLVQLGSNAKSFTATTLGANGFATPAMTGAVTIGGSAFENKNIYVFVANVANSGALAASSEVFVMKLNQQFLQTIQLHSAKLMEQCCWVDIIIILSKLGPQILLQVQLGTQ
jgi:hypothetical protein